MTQLQATAVEMATPDKASRPGTMNDIGLAPRISIQAFCESQIVAQTLDAASGDRRMARTHFNVHMGGIAAAIEYYTTSPTPNLIVAESDLGGNDLINQLSRLAQVCDADTKVIVIGKQNDVTLYRNLIQSGVSEYLVSPVSMADFMRAVTSIFVDPESGPIGKVLAFVGAKGGSGSSTICHNVAWAISTRFQSDVVLSDLDLAFGTANINLDQDPPQGIAEAVFSPDRLDDILLDRLLAKCAEHLSLLAAPSTLERTYDFEADAFSHILEVAQRSAPCVVVDLPHAWNGWTKQVLASADEVIITACPELANLRNTKNLIDTLSEIRPNDAKPRLVMNQVNMPKRPEISVADFVGPLGLEPSIVVPFDPALFGKAANNGQMIAEAEPKSPICESFDYLAQILTGKAELRSDRKKGSSILARLRLKGAR
jgi:pilus assembly protein CpaE